MDHTRLLGANRYTCKRYKPRDLAVVEDSGTNENRTVDSSGNSIYSGVSQKMLDEIQMIDLNGSYGTKIDTSKYRVDISMCHLLTVGSC
jgi:hypothetical protein